MQWVKDLPLDRPSAALDRPLLKGSWVVMGRVISRITRVITYIRGLLTPLITTHEPPSRP